MADEERLIIETAIDPSGLEEGLRHLQSSAENTGGQIERTFRKAASTSNADRAAARLAKAQLNASLAAADHAGKVKILQDALSKLTDNTAEYYIMQTRLTKAQQALDREQARSTTRQEAAQTKATRATQQATQESQRLARAELNVALAHADRTKRVDLLQQHLGKLNKGSLEYLRTQERLARAQHSLDAQSLSGSALPRTFAGFTGKGALQMAGALGFATSATEFVAGARQMAHAGQQINVSIDANRRVLGSLLQDMDRGNRVFAKSSEWARKYGFTQKEMSEAIRSASFLIKNSTAPVEKILEVQGRLAAFSPEQGLEGAAFAIRELMAGDTRSLVERFELSRTVANEWKAEVLAGGDAVEILDRGLIDLGLSNDVLAQRTKGVAGAQNNYNIALEDMQRRLGQLVQSSGWVEFTTRMAQQATTLLGGSTKAETDALIEQATSYQEFIQLRKNAISAGFASLDVGDNIRALYMIGNAITEQEFKTRKYQQAQEDLAAANEAVTDSLQGAGSAYSYYGTAQTAITGTITLLEGEIESLNADIVAQELALKKAQAALAPYEQAVEDAQAAVTARRAEHDAALAEYETYANARIEGERELQRQLFEIGQERAQAELALLDFQTGGGLDSALAPYRDDLAEAERATAGFEQAQRAAASAVEDAERELERQTDALALFDQAVESAQRNLDAQNDRLRDAEDQYKRVTDAITAQQDALNDHLNGPLIGDRADRERLQSFADRENALQQQLSRARLADDEKAEKRIREQLDRLREEENLVRLEIEATRGRQRRELEDLANSREQEQSYGDARAGIESALNEQDRLKDMLPDAQAAVDAQRAAVENAQVALDAATEAQRLHNVQIEEARIALESQKAVLDTANQALQTQRERVDELGQRVKAAEEEALKPFQDRINEVNETAQRIDLEGQLKFGPLRERIREAADETREFPFDVLITGMETSRDRVTETRDRLQEATTKLDEASAALERQKQPIEDQQKRLDELNLRLALTKSDLDGINTAQEKMVANAEAVKTQIEKETALYDSFAKQVERGAAALERQNRARSALESAPDSRYNAQAINTILRGTGLEGQGGNIVRFAQQYNVPAELALAMFRKEASFLTAGSSVANNNPGNIEYTGGKYGETRGADGRFGKYASVEAGIEAYFKLLNNVYRPYLDSGNIDELINKYAPPFENDTGLYQQQIAQWMQEYLQQILLPDTAATPRLQQGSLLEQLIAAMTQGGRLTGDWHTGPGWGGIDIGAPMGSDIRAVQSGRVSQVSYNPTSGNVIMIEDPVTGLKTYYGHMQKPSELKVGDLVEAGDVIGKVGSTGQSTGPHIHFQAWLNNVLKNPLELLELLVSAAYGTGAGTDMPWDDVPGYGAQSYAPNDPVAPTIISPETVAAVREFGSELAAGSKRYRQWVDSLDLPAAGAKEAAQALADLPIAVKITADQMRAYAEDLWQNGNPFAGQTLGEIEAAYNGDPAQFGGAGGNVYGVTDPRPSPLTGDVALPENLDRYITDPVEMSLMQVGRDTQAMRDLFVPGAWQPMLTDTDATWQEWSLIVIDSWREVIDYVRSGEDLIRRAAKNAENNSSDLSHNSPSPAGGTGGNGNTGNGTNGNVYTTNHIYTQNTRAVDQAMRAEGMRVPR